MNYNIASYLIYILVTYYITFVVGKICYRNGEFYLHRIIPERPEMVNSLNSVLLIAYYLLNLGYATLMLSYWPGVDNWFLMSAVLFKKIGFIVFVLGILHYNNLLITYLISKKINKQQQFKPLKS